VKPDRIVIPWCTLNPPYDSEIGNHCRIGRMELVFGNILPWLVVRIGWVVLILVSRLSGFARPGAVSGVLISRRFDYLFSMTDPDSGQ